MERLDIFPKTFDDFKERTLGGALISIVCCLLALSLFTAEFAQYRAVETVDRLDVDTRTLANSKLSINLDVVLPSLPCDEIVMDVVDESGSEQLAVTNTLHKLRIDRHGVPIDTPEAVDWSHTLAPAFHQRKVIQLMDDAHLQLAETLGHLEHEEEENPGLSAEEHAAHREELTTQAALLQGRLAHLTAVAEAAEHTEVVGDAAHQEHLAMTAQEATPKPKLKPKPKTKPKPKPKPKIDPNPHLAMTTEELEALHPKPSPEPSRRWRRCTLSPALSLAGGGGAARGHH